MIRTILPMLAGAALLAALVGPAEAQSVQVLGQFRDWTAYSTGAVCFAMSKPTEVTPLPDGYTQAYFYLSKRPADNVSNEINLVAGFDFAPDQPASLSVDGKDFDLFTQKDAAWLLDPGKADSLAGAMRAGSSLAVEGTNATGVKITETFSLSGATAASKAVAGC